jgi:hypothetical protein
LFFALEGNMPGRAEKEIHAYIDDLCGRGYYGEVTLYFQKGEIGNVRETARLGKVDILNRYAGSPAGGRREPVRRYKLTKV